MAVNSDKDGLLGFTIQFWPTIERWQLAVLRVAERVSGEQQRVC